MAGSSAQSPALAGSCIATGNSTTDHSRRNGLLCALAVVACVLVADPRANMPFIDDFSYTKTALDFARTGHFIYNGWAVEILGWLVPWGALFIKLFGFSFNVVRLSMLPIDMATVYLFHQILRRFGVNPQNAILGTLTMGLSPLFMPLAASYMTDVPGLLVILLCIYMCQRAVAATSDRAALLWLTFAMLLNVAGGTVRQIAWLGSLIMVPSTAWLLRERKGMKAAAVVLFLSSLLGVEFCLHWFNRQPYSVPEHIFEGTVHTRMLVHLAAQLLKCFLCLLLVVFPVLIAWLPAATRLDRAARLRILSLVTMLALFATLLYMKGHLDTWLMPWLTPVLAAQSALTSTRWNLLIALALSILVLLSGLICVEQIARPGRQNRPNLFAQRSQREEMAWILGPFLLAYVILLSPRGTYALIQDRYVLGLVPIAITIFLTLYQTRMGPGLSSIGVATLIFFALYATAGTYDFFAESRALVRSIEILNTAGVERKFILTGLAGGGLASDGWAQIEKGGHINDPRIVVPAGAYEARQPDLRLPESCTFWFTPYTPAIIRGYFVVDSQLHCLAPTNFPPVRYRAWLPPFHRAVYIQQRMTY